MNLTGRGKVFLTICILSVLFSYLIITLNYFPYLGIALSLLVFILFSYKYKESKTKETKVYLTFAVLFSILIFVRSEPFTTFLNLSAAVFFGLLMLIPSPKKSLGFIDYIYAPLRFMLNSIFATSDYYLEFKKREGRYGKIKWIEVVFGISIAIILMAIVLPLLSSANPFFQKIVMDIWNIFRLNNLLEIIGLETAFIWLLRVAFFLFFIYIIPKVMSLINKSGNYSLPIQHKQENFPLLIPKLILAIILIVFFITQFQFYFATDETLRNLGLSHSQHTRDVFTQLSLVAGIVLLLIYNSRHESRVGKLINWILGAQGIFLTLMAYKSDFEYISAWGLTYKRLYGLTFATWITGIFVLFFENFRHKKEAALFVKKTIIFSGVMLLAVNVLNFDYLIYHFQKARTGQGIDYTYLSTLSADSFSYKQQFLKLKEVSQKGDYSLKDYDNENPLIILRKIENLQRRYSKIDLRTLSLFEFWQYQQVKSEDTKEMRERYRSIQENSPAQSYFSCWRGRCIERSYVILVSHFQPRIF